MKPVYVLSGMSCTGKSTLLEHARTKGVKIIKSHTKQLLNMRFGYGKNSFDFLIMSQFMQVLSIADFDLGNEGKDIWMCERSIIDQYYFDLNKNGISQDLFEVDDMKNVIKSYFNYITSFGKKPLVIIDIYNYDKDWITASLSEHETRSYLWKSADEYIVSQSKYKEWYFNLLLELGINYEVIKLEIADISRFNSRVRDAWINNNILAYHGNYIS